MYQQQNNPNYNPDDGIMDDLGDAMTGGWWRKSKGIFGMLVRVNAMLLMVFIRKRIGLNLFSLGSWFWGSGWMLLVLLICQENWRQLVLAGATEGHQYSWQLLWWHGQFFVWLILIKWLVAYLSTGSNNPRWFRPRVSIGESILYPLVRRILMLIQLIDDEANPQTFWKINERRWMIFWEPLLLLTIGHQLKASGYSAYGNFLMIATVALAFTTFQAYKNTDMLPHIRKEAEEVGKMAIPMKEEKTNPRHIIGG